MTLPDGPHVKILISSCLLGEAVRYDGADARATDLPTRPPPCDR